VGVYRRIADRDALGCDSVRLIEDIAKAHWQSISTNILLKTIMREFKQRTRLAGAFASGQSEFMFHTVRLSDISVTK
jgi:ABC-type uncharacterized transport system auxiliary subunit